MLTGHEIDEIVSSLYSIQVKVETVSTEFETGIDEREMYYMELLLGDLTDEIAMLIGDVENYAELAFLIEGGLEAEETVEDMISRGRILKQKISGARTLTSTQQVLPPSYLHKAEEKPIPQVKQNKDWGGFTILRKQRG